MRIFAVFLALPLIEIGLFVTLGAALGLWPTLGFVLASAATGVFLLRRGAKASPRGQNGLMQLAGSGFSILAAVLLIVPGFLTSFIGAVLLVPLVQRGVVALIGHRLAARGFAFGSSAAPHESIIDGDYTVVPGDDSNSPPSKWTTRD